MMGYYGNVAYSTDGVNWTTKTVGSNYWLSVCYGNGKFVAVEIMEMSPIPLMGSIGLQR